MLDSFYIKNFRLFSELEVPKLGRLNLVVGKNNSGKSCLLEALHVYGSGASPKVLYNIVGARGENWALKQATREEEVLNPKEHPYRSFFPNYCFPTDLADGLIIGPLTDKEKRLLLILRSYVFQDRVFSPVEADIELEDVIPFLEKRQDGNETRLVNLELTLERGRLARRNTDSTQPKIKIQHIFTGDPDLIQLSQLWDRINLEPDKREQVFEALRLIDPNLREVVFVGRTFGITPIILFKDNDLKVPLSSLGDGMTRLFQIVVALVNASGGMLLIDEFENGLHYSVQPKIWELVFKVAQTLNVQVFATTHSWDCISAFQKAAENSDADSRLFQLGRSRRTSRKGQIIVNSYDREALTTASKNQLDLR